MLTMARKLKLPHIGAQRHDAVGCGGAAALVTRSAPEASPKQQSDAIAAAGLRKPEQGNRIVYVMLNECGRKQAYHGNVVAKSNGRGWFDVAFDDGDYLCVLMLEQNRGTAWDFSANDSNSVSTALRAVLRADAIARSGNGSNGRCDRDGQSDNEQFAKRSRNRGGVAMVAAASSAKTEAQPGTAAQLQIEMPGVGHARRSPVTSASDVSSPVMMTMGTEMAAHPTAGAPAHVMQRFHRIHRCAV